ncbi:MAG TPA: hypothetical protein VF607_03195 [Verrucomicrobiae bacterium]
MKNDTATTFLNFVLIVMVVTCLAVTYFTIHNIHELRGMQAAMTQVNSKAMMAQSLVNDVANFNAQAKNPDLAKILQSVTAKAPTAPAPTH